MSKGATTSVPPAGSSGASCVVTIGRAYCETCDRTRAYVKELGVAELRCPVCNARTIEGVGDD